MSRRHSLARFARSLLEIYPRQTTISFCLLVAAGLTEGVSLLMFVPALQLLHQPDMVDGTAARLFSSLGIPFGLGPVLVACWLLVALRSALVYIKNRYVAGLHFNFADYYRKRLYNALGEARWSCTGILRTADLEDTLTSSIGRIQSGTWSLILLAQAAVLFTVYLILSTIVSLTLTLLVGGLGFALLALLRGHRTRATELGQQVNRDRQESFRELSNLVHGLKVAKSFGWEKTHNERFSSALDTTREGSLRYVGLSAQSGLYFQLAAGTLLAGAVYFGSRFLDLDLPTLLVLVFCIVRLTPYLGQFQGLTQELLFALPSWEHAENLIGQLEEAREPPPIASQRFTLTHAIRTKSVQVRYSNSNKPAITDINLSLPVGSCTALIGPSGAGKSTLADVLLGLITPDFGEVYVDDTRLTSDVARAWRHRVGYVPQETFLLPESVRTNLLMGSEFADDRKLWHALRAAAAAEFVQSLPQGLDTVLGDRGSSLSGGERQRIALARALIREPLLLVLDEATSALDPENQQKIMTVLAGLRGKVTILLIAHNSALIKLADQVVHLTGGEMTSINSIPEADKIFQMDRPNSSHTIG